MKMGKRHVFGDAGQATLQSPLKPAELCRIHNLSVSYPGTRQKALADIGLSIEKGRRLAIIGESGSGKSTLAKTLASLLPRGSKTEGRIVWGAETPPIAGKDLGFVFQDPSASLNPVLTIGEQVAEGARRHLRLSWSAALEAAQVMLDRVHIPNAGQTMRAYPHQLSGGQRQRVAIAAALAARPGILIADEPTSALDMVVQAEIVALLDELVRAGDMTLIFITHDIALASEFADRIAIFRAGRLVETGPTRDVIDRPADDYTKSLLASHLDLVSPPLIARAPAAAPAFASAPAAGTASAGKEGPR
ncbi:MAG: ABC transporter ATP-binding protein [Neorhizobium sp.]|nr:ABC transporter ATP-binding protein [Neorhizobium sp.]